MRPIKIMTPLIALLLLGLGGWRLAHYLASKHHAFQGREFIQAHPLIQWLGPSQSATQNGYTMLAIQDASQPFKYQEANNNLSYQDGGNSSLQGGTAFWFKIDNSAVVLPPYTSSQTTSDAHLFTVTTHSSDGDTFPLGWELISSQPGPFFHATLPAGYPGTLHWIDLTVDDHHGHTATWRINHLPPMQHLIPPPVRLQNVYKNGGMTLTASAWRQRDPNNSSHPMVAMYRMHGAISPYQHQWEIAFLRHQWEWGLPNMPQQNGIMTIGFSDKGDFDDGAIPVENGFSGTADPYLNRNHYVRLFCELRQFETLTETVAFHNVPIQAGTNGRRYIAPVQPISLVTPSGITVTLSNPRTLPLGSYPAQDIGQPGINYSVDFDPKVGTQSLAKSPLFRRYQRLVTISLLAEPPAGYGGGSQMSIGNAMIDTFSHQSGVWSARSTSRLSPNGKMMQSLTLAVQQRVDLQKIPFTLTLPLMPHEPAAAK